MAISQFKDEYTAAFDPKAYLTDYGMPDAEGMFPIHFLMTALRNLPSGLLALEFGGGPTLYTVAALAPQAHEIHFCDYLASNLEEVRCWLEDEPNAFDWSPYIRLVLEAEGRPATAATVAQRVAEIRQKVSHLTICDALAGDPLDNNTRKYDLVMAHYCTDVATAAVSEWIQVICNISTLVKAGAWLLVGVTTGAGTNTLRDTPDRKSFPCVDLTDEDIYQGYKAAGYDLSTFYLDKMSLSGGREYTGLTNAIACKLDDRQL